jgi:acyl-CoA reductase-like NAD-dependent aldehyde dehydrogenase
MKSDLRHIHAAVEEWEVKRTRLSVADCVRQVIRVADVIKTKSLDLFAEQSGFHPRDVLVLWNEGLRFLEALPQLVAFHEQLTEFETKNAPTGNWSHLLGLEPWGKMLVCLPANAIIPLSFVLPTALIASGNRVVVAVSSSARETGLFILDALQECFGERLMIWRGGVRDAIECLAGEQPAIHALYYMGASKQFGEIAETCASKGVELIFEGEGRGIVVIDQALSDSELQSAAQRILAAKTFCLGHMCSAPNAVLIPAAIFEKFVGIYQAACMATSLEHCRAILSAPAVAESKRELNAQYGAARPHLSAAEGLHPSFWIVEADQACGAKELFSPDIFLAKQPDLASCLRAVSRSRFRLQVTLFSHEIGHLKELVSQTQFARYCYTMNPANQDALLPWGNYGRSGTSEVFDFYRKGLRRIIVESERSLADFFGK